MKSYGLEMLGPLILERVSSLPTWTEEMEGRLVYNESDDAIYYASSVNWVNIGTGGGASISDESYDETTWNNITTIGASKNSLRDKIFSTDEIIEKLLPERPPNLEDVTLIISPSSGSTYNAKRSSGTTIGTISPSDTATSVDILDDSTPSGVSNEDFYDGNNGQLSGKVDGSGGGHRTLTENSDVGTYVGVVGTLEITKDADYYSGQGAPKEDFWWALLAKVTPNSGLSIGEHIYKLIHSITGASQKAWILDDPDTPQITGYSAVPGSTTTRWISGVPSVKIGDTISCTFNVNGAVSECYNLNHIGQITSSAIQSAIELNFSSTPSKGDVLFVTANTESEVANNVYTEDAQMVFKGFNSKGGTGQVTEATGIRIDTVSPIETSNFANNSFPNQPFRVQSGSGLYPSSVPFDYGDTFDKTVSLNTNVELQLLNGKLQWPPATNYVPNIPIPGPDYSSLSGENVGSLTDVRWYTRKLAAVTSITGFKIEIEDSEDFSSIIETDLLLFAKIAGTTGWIDLNSAYPGTGNPDSDGDPALVIGSSSATQKRATFGSSAKTGDLYIRIGIPKTSSKKFSSIKLVEVS